MVNEQTVREGESMLADDAMNAEEVARYLQIGKNSVYQLAKSGQLASYHIGRKLRFTLRDVEAYIASTRQEALAQTGGGAVAGAAGQPEQTQAGTDAPALAASQKPSPAWGEGDAKTRVGRQTVEQVAAVPEDQRPFVVAGNDIAADLLAMGARDLGHSIARAYRNSYVGLVNLYAQQADAAVVHLYDLKSNTYNLPYVRNLVPGVSVCVVRLYKQPCGFVVKKGNPKRLSTWGSLLHEGVVLANRERGCAPRVLLDEKLRALEARAQDIEGYGREFESDALAASFVAAGSADVAIASQRVASQVADVEFVPLQTECVDVVLVKSPRTRAVVRSLKKLASEDSFRNQLAKIDGADVSDTGAIVYEC